MKLVILITLLLTIKILNAQINQVSILIKDCALASKQDEETLSDKILNYAKKNQNKVVLTGECWDLPFYALLKSNGKVPKLDGTKDEKYTWSSKIVTQKDNLNVSLIKPGDIIQFLGNPGNGCSFKMFVSTIEEIKNDRCIPRTFEISRQYACRPHFVHSAIISKVVDVGTGTLEVIHQWKGKKVFVDYLSLIDHFIYLSKDKFPLEDISILRDKSTQEIELKKTDNQKIILSRINYSCGVVLESKMISNGNYIIYRPEKK
jgi:hypothetical protein